MHEKRAAGIGKGEKRRSHEFRLTSSESFSLLPFLSRLLQKLARSSAKVLPATPLLQNTSNACSARSRSIAVSRGQPPSQPPSQRGVSRGVSAEFSWCGVSEHRSQRTTSRGKLQEGEQTTG